MQHSPNYVAITFVYMSIQRNSKIVAVIGFTAGQIHTKELGKAEHLDCAKNI